MQTGLERKCDHFEMQIVRKKVTCKHYLDVGNAAFILEDIFMYVCIIMVLLEIYI